MAEDTKIQWCDATFNHVRGCTKVSDGCKFCYAETLSGRNPKVLGVWGPNGTRVVAAESQWREPLKWNRLAAEGKLPDGSPNPDGHRPRVFCESLADVFEDWPKSVADSQGNSLYVYDEGFAPLDTRKDIVWRDGGWSCNCNRYIPGRPLTMDDVRKRLFALIDATPNLDWLLLTKRPENVLGMTYDAWCKPVPGHVSQNAGDGRHWQWPANVWLGTSVENQAAADERIPHLLKCPAAVRFLSCEPLLGEIVFGDRHNLHGGIHWGIIGGESGTDSRVCRVEWVRDLVRQFDDAAVRVFVKQLGANVTTTLPDWEAWPGHTGPTSPVQFSGDGFGNYRVSGLRDKKAGDPAEWPMELRVREFPVVAAAPKEAS